MKTFILAAALLGVATARPADVPSTKPPSNAPPANAPSSNGVSKGVVNTINGIDTFFFDNHCSFPLYIQSSLGGVNESVVTISPQRVNAYNSPITNAQKSKHAFSLSKSDPTVTRDLLQIVFTVGPDGRYYYSLSTIYGDPLKADGYGLYSNNQGASIISPPGRTGDPDNEYSPSNPNGIGAVFSVVGGDFVFSACNTKA